MGNLFSTEGTSTVFDNLQQIIEENPRHFIYHYKGGHFLITPEQDENPDFYELTIEELSKAKKGEDLSTILDVYVEDDGTYYATGEENYKGTPYFQVDRYSDDVYLGYLYATRSRTGRFIEGLICQLAKELGSSRIFLMDASRSGNCENFSTSIQIFISEDKKFSTYYEVLGYRNDDPFHDKHKAALKYLYPKIKDVPMKTLCDEVNRKYGEVQSTSDWIHRGKVGLYALGFLFHKEKNLNMNIIEYISMLISKGHCESLKILFENIYVLDSSNLTKFITYLEEISYGNYYKDL